MKYSNRSLWKKVIGSPLSLVALLVLILVMGRAAHNIYEKSAASEARLAQAQMELAKLTARKDEVATKVGQLSTDQGIEAEVRTKFHAVKDGESVAVIIDGSQGASAIKAASTSGILITPKLSWWRKVLHVFGF